MLWGFFYFGKRFFFIDCKAKTILCATQFIIRVQVRNGLKKKSLYLYLPPKSLPWNLGGLILTAASCQDLPSLAS